MERAGWCYRSPFPSFPPPHFPAERPVSLARKARLSLFAHFAWVLRDHFWLAQVQQQPFRAADRESLASLGSSSLRPLLLFLPSILNHITSFLSSISPPPPPFLGVSSFFFFLIRLIIFFDLTTVFSLFSHLHRPLRRYVSRIPKPTLFCFDGLNFAGFQLFRVFHLMRVNSFIILGRLPGLDSSLAYGRKSRTR